MTAPDLTFYVNCYEEFGYYNSTACFRSMYEDWNGDGFMEFSQSKSDPQYVLVFLNPDPRNSQENEWVNYTVYVNCRLSKLKVAALVVGALGLIECYVVFKKKKEVE